MKRLIIKLLLFSIPVVLVFLPPLSILYKAGENFTDLDEIIKDSGSYKVGYAYNESNYKYLKWKEVVEGSKKSILAIGSSRVLQFREQMFDSPFYNAGYTIVGISDFLPFLKSIPEQKIPKCILVNLDQWMFNANWDAVEKKNSIATDYTNYKPTPTFSTYKQVWQDLLSNKLVYSSVFKHNSNNRVKLVGLNAKLNNAGFRKDGSMDYGDQISRLLEKSKNANDYGFLETSDRIKKGIRRFEYGEKVNVRAIQELDSFLSYCKQKNIQVIAFLPPFSPKIFHELSSSGKHSYIGKIYHEVEPIFLKYQYEFYDLTNPDSLNSLDSEFVDGFHGGEFTYGKIIDKMVKNKSSIKKFVNILSLEEDLQNKKNRFIVY
jgi:hypothetical protein